MPVCVCACEVPGARRGWRRGRAASRAPGHGRRQNNALLRQLLRPHSRRVCGKKLASQHLKSLSNKSIEKKRRRPAKGSRCPWSTSALPRGDGASGRRGAGSSRAPEPERLGTPGQGPPRPPCVSARLSLAPRAERPRQTPVSAPSSSRPVAGGSRVTSPADALGVGPVRGDGHPSGLCCPVQNTCRNSPGWRFSKCGPGTPHPLGGHEVGTVSMATLSSRRARVGGGLSRSPREARRHRWPGQEAPPGPTQTTERCATVKQAHDFFASKIAHFIKTKVTCVNV